MRPAGRHRFSRKATVVSLTIIATGIGMALYVRHRVLQRPSTDDATIDADVVHVAAAVGGRILQIKVTENAHVSAGDVLFQIDPTPFQLVVDQARADLGEAEGMLDSRRRFVETQKSNVSLASNQITRAATNRDLSARTVERLRPLATQGYVPRQQLDQARTAARDAETSLQQARTQESAAAEAVNTLQGAEAAVRARKAALGVALRALDDTTVRATHDGRVTGLTVSSGEMVAPSQSLFVLLNTEEWYAVGNFRETELKHIAVGDCATVYSMIDRRQPMKGVVEGIGFGVLDEERVNVPRSVPYVERSLNWVRVAQRFPVRVRIERPVENLTRLGASAVVEIKHGAACR